MPQNKSKRTSSKAGLEAGTLFYIGKKQFNDVKITIFNYNQHHISEFTANNFDQCRFNPNEPMIKWINVDGVHKPEIIGALGDQYSLHPLLQEDITNTEQRPKFDDFDTHLYVVLKMLNYNDTTRLVEYEQVSLVMGNNYVISFQEDKEGDIWEDIRNRLRNPISKSRKLGADFLLYSLLDAIVDHYFIIIEKVGDEIEEMEERVMYQASNDMLKRIYKLRRELIFLRKSIWPLREVLSRLDKSESNLISPTTAIFFRDTYDHTIQIIDTIEVYRDVLSGMLEVYLSNISLKMNGVMKVLTVISTIFMPLTFIAGVYGMNFDMMPELHWKYGYIFVWLMMCGVVASMIIFFKRKGWF